MTSQSSIYPVILSGGSGTRLWPLSRVSLPKQLLALDGNLTMIQNTVLRSSAVGNAPILICNESHRFLVAEQMQTIGVVPKSIVLEPLARNTAAAATVAAILVEQTDPQGIVLLLPSDHIVSNGPEFERAVELAASGAREGAIVTFGITPAYGETGYGYIQAGNTREVGDVLAVKRFVEKPDAATAESYLAEGGYYWNSGMFVFRADIMLSEMRKYEPGVVKACEAALAAARRDQDFVRLDAAEFEKAKSISLDYALMEKTDKAAVVPCAFGWSDVGAWSSLWSLHQHDEAGNVLQGDVIVHDSGNSFVRSDRGLTALVGVQDLVVIVTSDAVLVANKNRSQDVKAIVDELKRTNRTEHTEHKVVYRPWGSYQGVDEGEGYQVKQIVVKPGGRLSLQSHKKRAEHWIVVQGTARVTCDDKVFLLHENQSAFIPLNAKHRLENAGRTPLRLIEVQSGSYLGEDDIVRYEDAYGRVEEMVAKRV